jgi:hypothetical protein
VEEYRLGCSAGWVVVKKSVVRRMASAGRSACCLCTVESGRNRAWVGWVPASAFPPKNAKNTHGTNQRLASLVMVVGGGKRPAAARQNGCCCCVANLQRTRTTSLECVFFTREQVVLLLCPAQQTKCESARVGQAENKKSTVRVREVFF